MLVPPSAGPPSSRLLCLACGLLGGIWGRSSLADAGPYATTVSVTDAPRPDDPATVSVIDLSQPGQKGVGRSVSLAEVIEGEPGVRVQSAGGLGQFSGALLRGAASSEVAILVDGVPLNRGGQAAIDLSQVPVDGVERVEIYRGVPPAELGIDAIGGAINLVTRRGGGPPSWQLFAGSGSFGLRKGGASYTAGPKGASGVRIAASLSYQGATGDFPYYYTAGFVYHLEEHGELRRRNDGFDQVTATLRVAHESGNGDVFVEGQGVLKQQGVAGIGQPGAQVTAPDLSLGQALLLAGFRRRFHAGRVHLSGMLHGLLDRSQYRDLQASPPALSESLGVQAGGQLGLKVLTRPPHQLLALIEVRHEDWRNTDLCPAPREGCSQLAPTRSQRWRGVATLSGDLRFGADRLVFQPGVQVLLSRSHLLPLPGDPASLGTRDSDAWFASPRMGVRVRLLPWLLVRASAGRFVRLPTFLELFGDRAFFRASLDLRPESAATVEAGMRGDGQVRGVHLSLDLSGFSRQVGDLIQTVHDGLLLRADNVGSARMLGGEAEARISLWDLLSLRLTYSFLDARDLSDVPDRSGNLLPGRPRHSLLLRADLGHGPYRLFYELDHVSSLFLDPANLQFRPERTLHGLGVQLGPYTGAHLALAAEVRNLLDTRILPVTLPASSDGRTGYSALVDFLDYPLPGRALYVTLTARL